MVAIMISNVYWTPKFIFGILNASNAPNALVTLIKSDQLTLAGWKAQLFWGVFSD